MQFVQKHLPNYSYEDYSLWEGNWELINGIPYAMSPAPTMKHQLVNSNLVSIFREALKKGCGKCKAYMPIDWKIKVDTVIQPDLSVVCGGGDKKYLDFAPVLVAEILSPSTAMKDRNLKKEIYLSQNVKYYLILDPSFNKIEIYENINGTYNPIAVSPKNYIFTFEDNCTADVNFEDIWD
jgi:Uma2 family endonuclease